MLAVQYNVFPYKKKGEMEYSETPPYGHLSNTVTSLLQPLFFGCLAKTSIHFLVKKTLVNMAKFFWPIGDRIIGVPLYPVSSVYKKNYMYKYIR